METEHILKQRIAELEAENAALRQRLRVMEPLEGITAEVFVAELVGGAVTRGLAPHDIIGRDGTTFEVKFARLNIPGKGRSRRWPWRNALGSGGAKRYDRLILVGETDPRFRDRYLEPDSPYVIFDVPFEAVSSLMKDRQIAITTSPSRTFGEASPIARRLFQEFCVSSAQLRERYNRSNHAMQRTAGSLALNF
jgi:hypothetical protein